MYFRRIEKLKTEMARQPLSERETLPYLVTFAALSTAALGAPHELNTVGDYLGAAWSVLVAVYWSIGRHVGDVARRTTDAVPPALGPERHG